MLECDAPLIVITSSLQREADRCQGAERIILAEFAFFWIRQDPTSQETGELLRLQKLVWSSKIARLQATKVF